ncbi:MAG: hypothetical protein FWC46_01390, partial [Actinomycetia bacterium]|nr:hypothetical protein [Actinomycetes bacterium]
MSTTQGWNEPIPTGGYGTGAGLPDAEPEFTGSTAGLAHLPEGWRWRVQMVGRGMRFVPVPPGLADPGTVRLRASLTTPPSLPPPVPSIPSTPTPLAPMSAPPPAVQTPAVQTPAGPVASAPVWPVQPAPARPARSPIPSGQELAAIADMLSGSAERLAEEEWRRLARIMPQIDWSAPTPAVTPPEDAAPEEPAAVAPVMAPADAITQPMAAVPADVAATPAPAVEFAPPAAYAPAPVVPLASFAPPTPTPGVPEPIDALPPGTVAAILGAVDADLGGPEFANPEPATPEGVMSEVPESQEPAIPGAPAYPEPVAAPAVLPELPAEAESGLPTVPIAVEPPAAYREAGVAPEGAPGMAAPAVAEAPAPVVVDETPGPSRARGFSWGHVTFPNVVRAEWIKLWS